MKSDDCEIIDSKCHLERIENWHSRFEADIKLLIETLGKMNARSIEATRECSKHYKKTIELTKAKTRFTFEVSHELKAPLASVYNIINVILDGYLEGDTSKQIEYLTRAKVRVKSIIDLLNDLLVFSRLEESANELEKEVFGVGQLFPSLVEEMNEYAMECSIRLEWNLCDDCPLIYGNEELIRRVFANLIHNAVKYSMQDNLVRVTAEKVENYFLLIVEDNGIGIKDDEIEKIFDIFFRGENTKRDSVKEGIGLGLSLVKRIIDAHKGFIRVESRLHEGTTVEVRFPVAIKEGA